MSRRNLTPQSGKSLFKKQFVTDYCRTHDKPETLAFVFSLLGLDKEVLDEEVWRTNEEGKHFKLESTTGEIKAGFGGKFNGMKIGTSWKDGGQLIGPPAPPAPKTVQQKTPTAPGKPNEPNHAGTQQKRIATEVKAEHLPSVLKKKQTAAFHKAMHEIQDRDPETCELYTHMAKMESAGIPGFVQKGVTYSDAGGQFRIKRFAFNDILVSATLRLPKFENPELRRSETATTAHELAHMMDFMCREGDHMKNGDFHEKFMKEFTDLRSNNKPTSERMRKMFDEAEKRIDESDANIDKKWEPIITDYNDQISDILRNRNFSGYDALRKKRDKAERDRKTEQNAYALEVAGGAGPLMDIYQMLGDRRRRLGHDKVSNDSIRLSECWANWCELSIAYPKERAILEEEKPEFCELMKKMSREMLGRY